MSEPSEVVRVKAPCCHSIRECNVRKYLVIDPQSARVEKVISAVRCYRDEEKVVYVSQNYAVIEAYVSNRGNLRLTTIYLPPGINEDEVKTIAREYMGFYEEEYVG